MRTAGESPSLACRAFNAYARLVIRRADWGDGDALARRARRVFGMPRLLQWLAVRGMQLTEVRDGTVRGEWIDPPGPPKAGTVMYVHGGGYVAGTAAQRRPIGAALARLTGRRVFLVDYRLAPEARFPAAVDDVAAAYRWLCATGAGARVALAGESAGGGAILVVAQQARQEGWPPPACLVALSPWTNLTADGGSRLENDGRCAMFHPQNVTAFARAYLGNADPRDPRASPLFGGVAGLPPTLLQVGAHELLLDDARAMHQRLQAAGVESTLEVVPHVAHAWQLAVGWMPEADRAVATIAQFLRRHLGG